MPIEPSSPALVYDDESRALSGARQSAHTGGEGTVTADTPDLLVMLINLLEVLRPGNGAAGPGAAGSG